MKKYKVDNFISVPNSVERDLDNKCWICGKDIDNIYKYSRDHILPRAILKWCDSYFDSNIIEMVRKVFNSRGNILRAHCKCNEGKGSRIINPEEFDGCIYVSDKQKKMYKEVFKKAELLIIKYRTIINSLLKKHKYKCAWCNVSINKNNCVIRRINKRYSKTLKNSMLLCKHCSAMKKD